MIWVFTMVTAKDRTLCQPVNISDMGKDNRGGFFCTAVPLISGSKMLDYFL